MVDSGWPREKRKFSDIKVYKRRVFTNIKNSENVVPLAPAVSSPAAAPQKDSPSFEKNYSLCHSSADVVKDLCVENIASSPAAVANGGHTFDGNTVVHESELNHRMMKDKEQQDSSMEEPENQPLNCDATERESEGLPPQNITPSTNNDSLQNETQGNPSTDVEKIGVNQAEESTSFELHHLPSDEVDIAFKQIDGKKTTEKENPGSKVKESRIDLRRQLETELANVRNWVKKIEDKQDELTLTSIPVRELSTPKLKQPRPVSQLALPIHDNGAEGIEKEKRTPKANQFYRNSEFLLANDKFPPPESNKKSKLNGKRHGVGESNDGFGPNTKIYKRCGALLERLMKHKHGWVFNSPVDVEGLRLYDYFTIIKYPMDLGTIKTRLSKNWYKASEEFAEDVRLTFHNAMTYNPKGQDVHLMAEQLLQMFEEKWELVRLECDSENRMRLSTAQPRRAPPPRALSRSQSLVRPKVVLKKPKAKDANKRDMTYEEKQKLSANLESLPLEKLDNIVQIIKKRNSALSQNDDEIEVDIDSVDAETLWELDRFITNYKKSLSKSRRKAALANQQAQEKPTATEAEPPAVSKSHPLQEEDDQSKTSSSSSSSTDSGSSSSDSDSDSSSASSDNGE